MATVRFEHVTQRSPTGVQAVTDLDLDVAEGEVLVVAGGPDAGTSAALRMLAGLEDVSEGTIWVGDRCVNGVAPRERQIATVFGTHAHYPHLTVADNLARPLEVAGLDESERHRRVRDVAAVLGLADLLGRMPRELSCGRRHLLALGRAMVQRPEVCVLDEPLASLDAELRVTMCAEVAGLQRAMHTTMLYATHDQGEAMAIGDRVAVMHLGAVQQVGTPTELYDAPATVDVAGFVGSPRMNRIVATIRRCGERVVAVSGAADVTALSPGLTSIADLTGHGRFVLGVRPEHLALVPAGRGVPARVRLVERLGSTQRLHLDVDGLQRFVPERGCDLDGTSTHLVVDHRGTPVAVRAGDAVGLAADARHLHVFDGATGRRVAH